MAIDVSIMIEGQDGLSWPRWQRLARAAEELGFSGLYRSDHFLDSAGDAKDALEAWISFAWLASNTQRIAFGPLVSPLSFRNPVMLAWQASGIDALGSGRLRLGVGAGWKESEHQAFGFDLPPLNERFARLEEGIQVIKALTRSAEPTTFDGTYFQLSGAMMSPRSPRSDGPPLVIGGNGPKRTLPLVAKYADEWNSVSLTLDQFTERNARLAELIEGEGRAADAVKRTLMTRGLVGRDEQDLLAKEDAETIERTRERGGIVGTPSAIVDQLGRMAEAGVQGVMLQWLDLDDIAGLELIASEVLPQIRA
ncbi:MAG TPA: TIGR03560 family F420-dependent LLM class oxidoreductase [Thermomicrobiales bacterium]|nr:TIGR03560 family F420-dependent LLM class oxidoreductase [Thermomicrobiales bacterium]